MKVLILFLSFIFIYSCSDSGKERFDNYSEESIQTALKARDYQYLSSLREKGNLTHTISNKENENGITPLLQIYLSYQESEGHFAKKRRLKAIQDLIKAGADVDFVSEDNDSALSVAINNNDIEGANLIIQALTNQGLIDKHLEIKYAGSTACEIIKERGYKEIKEALAPHCKF